MIWIDDAFVDEAHFVVYESRRGAWIFALAFSPNGETLLAGGQDTIAGGPLWVLEKSEGDNHRELDSHGDYVGDKYVLSLSYSPDGKTILVGTTRDGIKLFDSMLGEKFVPTAEFFDFGVLAAVFSPDGNTIFADCDSGLKAWRKVDANQWLRNRSAFPILERTRSIALSPDGKYLVSASDDALRLWELIEDTKMSLAEAQVIAFIHRNDLALNQVPQHLSDVLSSGALKYLERLNKGRLST